MGTLLGYVLGRRRERPDVEWAQQLDAHADQLQRVIEELERENALLWDAVEVAERLLPNLHPTSEPERELVEEMRAAVDKLQPTSRRDT